VRELEAAGLQVIAARLTRARLGRNLLTAMLNGQPLQARYSWQPALVALMARALRDEPGGFDVVHTEHIRGAEFGLALKEAAGALPQRPAFVWDSVDCISVLFEQAAQRSRSGFGKWVTRLELPRTRRYEGRVTRQFDRVLAVSRHDAQALEQLAGCAPGSGQVRVVPNGVDLDYFRPHFGPRTPRTIVFSGKMSYHANATAALHLIHHIMPRVWAHEPEAHLVIAGSAPTKAVRALGERHAPRVQVTGYVPDLRPHLQSAAAAVAPITYGAGMQNKVVEAMACGTPVVASPRAVSALAVEPGVDVLVAESPDDFAAALVRLLKDEALRRQLGENGYAYVSRNLRWPAVAEQLEGIYGEVRGRT
jgi:glycosyltransferase involved in cell wall biosynthesis